jgi:hypothetical protein
MPNNELFNNIIYPIIVGLILAIILFISNLLYNKYKRNKKEVTPKNENKELLLEKLLFEVTGSTRYFIEVNTKNSYLVVSVLLVNNGSITIIVRDIKISMGGIIGNLTQEHKIKILYHAEREKSYTIGNKVSFPFALLPTIPNNFALTFLFTNPAVSIGKFDLIFDTSEGDLIIPVSTDIKH